MNKELVQRIRDCSSLPSLPAIALQVLDLAQNEQVDLNAIADVISKDAAISSKVLRTVNSSFYGRSQSVSTISHAMVLLGIQSVKSLVLGFSLVGNLKGVKARGFSHINYWRRSIYAATAARLLCDRLHIVQQEECFLAALLQDIGMLVLDRVTNEQYEQLCEKAQSHEQLPALEAKALGLTHADVSGLLADHWRLPPLLREPMARHHRPQDSKDPSLRRLAEVVAAAGRCADVFVEERPADAITYFRRFCMSRCEMSEGDCDALLEQICKRTRENASLFEISLAPVNYEEILRKANEALVALTITTQQRFAQLEVENEQLQKSASTDALTDLGNRGGFDRFMAEQWQAASGGGGARALSIVMLDLDHFKRVNDTYGHAAGDQVLVALGRLLKAASRAQHRAFRYGGEEFALVMPGASKATAAATAESIRRALCARPVKCGGEVVPATASFGVASMEKGGPFANWQQLVRAADSALYAAKNAGRNHVKVFSVKVASAA